MKKASPTYRPDGRNRAGLAARQSAAAVLGKVIDNHRSLDSLMEPGAGGAQFDALIAKDRALVRAIVTTALRHRGRIERILLHVLDRKPPSKARHLLHTLHVASAQILFMDIPDSAAVNLAVTALREDRRSSRFASMANAILRRIGSEKAALLERYDQWELAFPQWLAKRIRSDYGQEKAAAIAAMTSREPSLDLTLSPKLTERDRTALIGELQGFELPTGSVRIPHPTPVSKLPGYMDGSWWVQDTASALPARLLGPMNGLQVADLCAAPGGKTAQLAAGGADVSAVDISAARLVTLRENLLRLHLEAEPIEADILTWQPENKFDAVLLDAPCSSTGTIRRHPDVKWTKSTDDIVSLVALQKKLIQCAKQWVRPGGVFVYANCSLLKSEGEDIVASLTGSDSELEPFPVQPEELFGKSEWINGQGALRILPSYLPNEDVRLAGMDGFFAARFRVK